LNTHEARIQVFDPNRRSGNGKVSEDWMSIGNTSGGERGRKSSDLSGTEELLNCVPKRSRRKDFHIIFIRPGPLSTIGDRLGEGR
jgi:hypothetical protein